MVSIFLFFYFTVLLDGYKTRMFFEILQLPKTDDNMSSPLDIPVLASVKKKFQRNCAKRVEKNKIKKLTVNDLDKIINDKWYHTMTPNDLRRSFQKTGL